MPELRALYVLRQNIRSLLHARGESQTSLAFWLRHNKAWISKFLTGSREIQLKDLDGIADFFGIATYQLFQPGISSLTERRKAHDRRQQDRRISAAQREMMALGPQTKPRSRKAN